MNKETKIEKILLDTSAVKLSPDNPFTWSSGWKSPIYCDNRVILSFAEHRNTVKEKLARLITENYPDCDTLIGVATAGIAIGALVADELGISYAYCRPKPKEHGMGKQLEGHVNSDANIVVIEDLISTGGSSLKVVNFLRENGFNVLGMAALFTYGFKTADDNFKNAECSLYTLGNYQSLIPIAMEMGYVTQENKARLDSWRLNPETWA